MREFNAAQHDRLHDAFVKIGLRPKNYPMKISMLEHDEQLVFKLEYYEDVEWTTLQAPFTLLAYTKLAEFILDTQGIEYPQPSFVGLVKDVHGGTDLLLRNLEARLLNIEYITARTEEKIDKIIKDGK